MSLQGEITIEQKGIEVAGRAANDFYQKLSGGVDERWGTSRGEGAEATAKPLVDYDEWQHIEGVYKQERIKNVLIEGEVCGENVPRWGNWRKKDTLWQWSWLRLIGLSPPAPTGGGVL